jgi:hypothetical protein
MISRMIAWRSLSKRNQNPKKLGFSYRPANGRASQPITNATPAKNLVALHPIESSEDYLLYRSPAGILVAMKQHGYEKRGRLAAQNMKKRRTRKMTPKLRRGNVEQRARKDGKAAEMEHLERVYHRLQSFGLFACVRSRPFRSTTLFPCGTRLRRVKRKWL